MSFKVNSVLFARGTGLGLRMCVQFQDGMNRNYRLSDFLSSRQSAVWHQWYYYDKWQLEVSCFCLLCLPRGDRYDALRACIGDSLCQKLHDLNVFLVSMTDTVTLFANALLVQLTPTALKIREGSLICATAE